MNKNILINMWQSECKTTLNSKQIGCWSLKKNFSYAKRKIQKGYCVRYRKMFFNCDLSIKMHLLNEVSVAA